MATNQDLEAIRKLLGVPIYVSRPLICYVQDVIKERDTYKTRAEQAEALINELKNHPCACDWLDGMLTKPNN